jgi:hypothetical protein
MRAGSPLELLVWRDLRQALTAFASALPPEVAAWVRLGEETAVSLGPVDDEDRLRGVALLQRRLSEMRPQPLLEGVTLESGVFSVEEVADFHRRILYRLQGAGWPDGAGLAARRPPQGPPPPSPPTFAPPDDVSKLAKALGLLATHPELTDTEIARRIGCSRTSLYRMQRFVQAKAALQSGRGDFPRANMSRDRAGNPSTDGVYDRWPGKNDEE